MMKHYVKIARFYKQCDLRLLKLVYQRQASMGRGSNKTNGCMSTLTIVLGIKQRLLFMTTPQSRLLSLRSPGTDEIWMNSAWRAYYMEDFKWHLHFQFGVAFWRVVLIEVYFEGPYQAWRALKASIWNTSCGLMVGTPPPFCNSYPCHF